MTLRLPKLLDDGCVLQAGVDMHIWGTGDPGRIVLTRLADERHMVQVKDDGTWNAPYGPIEAGGPYELTICYEDGAERISRQCYAGEVFLCSGQSNMELPMAWVRADYPQEWDRDPDPLLRQYKVIPDYDFKGPRDDHDRAFWQGCDADTLDALRSNPGWTLTHYERSPKRSPVLNRTLAMVWRRKEASIPLPSGTGGTRRLDTRPWPMRTMSGCH